MSQHVSPGAHCWSLAYSHTVEHRVILKSVLALRSLCHCDKARLALDAVNVNDV